MQHDTTLSAGGLSRASDLLPDSPPGLSSHRVPLLNCPSVELGKNSLAIRFIFPRHGDSFPCFRYIYVREKKKNRARYRFFFDLLSYYYYYFFSSSSSSSVFVLLPSFTILSLSTPRRKEKSIAIIRNFASLALRKFAGNFVCFAARESKHRRIKRTKRLLK